MCMMKDSNWMLKGRGMPENNKLLASIRTGSSACQLPNLVVYDTVITLLLKILRMRYNFCWLPFNE